MIMRDLKQYEDTAVHLAENRDELHAWRTQLAANRLTAPLYDTERWVLNPT